METVNIIYTLTHTNSSIEHRYLSILEVLLLILLRSLFSWQVQLCLREERVKWKRGKSWMSEFLPSKLQRILDLTWLSLIHFIHLTGRGRDRRNNFAFHLRGETNFTLTDLFFLLFFLLSIFHVKKTCYILINCLARRRRLVLMIIRWTPTGPEESIHQLDQPLRS